MHSLKSVCKTWEFFEYEIKTRHRPNWNQTVHTTKKIQGSSTPILETEDMDSDAKSQVSYQQTPNWKNKIESCAKKKISADEAADILMTTDSLEIVGDLSDSDGDGDSDENSQEDEVQKTPVLSSAETVDALVTVDSIELTLHLSDSDSDENSPLNVAHLEEVANQGDISSFNTTTNLPNGVDSKSRSAPVVPEQQEAASVQLNVSGLEEVANQGDISSFNTTTNLPNGVDSKSRSAPVVPEQQEAASVQLNVSRLDEVPNEGDISSFNRSTTTDPPNQAENQMGVVGDHHSLASVLPQQQEKMGFLSFLHDDTAPQDNVINVDGFPIQQNVIETLQAMQHYEWDIIPNLPTGAEPLILNETCIQGGSRFNYVEPSLATQFAPTPAKLPKSESESHQDNDAYAFSDQAESPMSSVRTPLNSSRTKSSSAKRKLLTPSLGSALKRARATVFEDFGNDPDAGEETKLTPRRTPKWREQRECSIEGISVLGPGVEGTPPSVGLYSEKDVEVVGITNVTAKKVGAKKNNKSKTGRRTTHAGRDVGKAWDVLEEEAMIWDLTLKDVGGAGHCLYLSLVDQLVTKTNYSGTHMDLRREVCDFMAENADVYKHFIAARTGESTEDQGPRTHEDDTIDLHSDNETRLMMRLSRHIEEQRGNAYGDHTVLDAVAKLHNARIQILNCDPESFETRWVVVESQNNKHKTTDLILGFVPQVHYVSLVEVAPKKRRRPAPKAKAGKAAVQVQAIETKGKSRKVPSSHSMKQAASQTKKTSVATRNSQKAAHKHAPESDVLHKTQECENDLLHSDPENSHEDENDRDQLREDSFDLDADFEEQDHEGDSDESDSESGWSTEDPDQSNEESEDDPEEPEDDHGPKRRPVLKRDEQNKPLSYVPMRSLKRPAADCSCPEKDAHVWVREAECDNIPPRGADETIEPLPWVAKTDEIWARALEKEPVGLREQPKGNSPMDFWDLLFEDSMWDMMRESTDEHIMQEHNNTTNKNSRYFNYEQKRVAKSEFYAFMGILIAMCLVTKSQAEWFWRTKDEIVFTPFFGKVMSRNRFQCLQWNLHVSNDPPASSKSGKSGKKDPFDSVRPLIEMFNRRARAVYNPGKMLGYDELTWKVCGRAPGKKYNKSKPDKEHFELFAASDSANGYLLGVELNHGAKRKYKLRRSKKKSGTIITEQVMGHLDAMDLLDKGRHVYTDNRYTCPILAQELLERSSHLCGTVRDKASDMPQKFKHTHKGLTAQNKLRKKGTPLQREEVMFRRNKEMLAIKFEDRNTVRMLSTIHRAECAKLPPGYRKIRKGKGKGKTVYEFRLKPVMVLAYNLLMNAVDRSGQMAGNNDFSRPTKSYKFKFIVHVLVAIMTNAYILYKLVNPKGTKSYLTHTMFCSILASQLIKRGRASQFRNDMDFEDTEVGGGSLAKDAETTRLIGRSHWPAPTPSSEKRVRLPRKCVACNEKDGKVKKSAVICKQCNVPLCLFPCFEFYHTKNNYLDAIKKAREGDPKWIQWKGCS